MQTIEEGENDSWKTDSGDEDEEEEKAESGGILQQDTK